MQIVQDEMLFSKLLILILIIHCSLTCFDLITSYYPGMAGLDEIQGFFTICWDVILVPRPPPIVPLM